MTTAPAPRQVATRRSPPNRRPQVICHDNLSNSHIVSELQQLHEDFTPTPWLFNEHAQLIFHSLRKGGRRSRVLLKMGGRRYLTYSILEGI